MLCPADFCQVGHKNTAEYLFMKSEFFYHTTNTDASFIRLDDLFQGRVPSRIVVVFVATDAFSSSFTSY